MAMISNVGRRLAAVTLLAFVGCSDGNPTMDTLPRKAIKGTVTLDGQPLPDGSIQFDPVERGPGTTLATGGIKDGKFAIDQASGPVPGKYKVSISSRAPVKVVPGEPPGPMPKMEPEKVPAQFNTKSTLTKEIGTGGDDACNFDLKSH